MQRFTISLDDALATKFDELIANKGYDNRSEAVRDLIRHRIDDNHLQTSQAAWCVATLNYVYDHHDTTVLERVMALQHAHHDLIVTSLHIHLDHAHCLETVVLRGATKAVTAFSEALIALRGVRHGSMQLVPLAQNPEPHKHGAGGTGQAHRHFNPLS
jgi:CopG family transcriptional regulator, nickel-responsive regulator